MINTTDSLFVGKVSERVRLGSIFINVFTVELLMKKRVIVIVIILREKRSIIIHFISNSLLDEDTPH